MKVESKMLTVENVKIGFIGFGNMAQAMANGLLYKGVIEPERIYACAKNWDKLCDNTRKKGMNPCKDAKEVTKKADLLIVAVKPYMIKEVLTPIKEELKNKIVVSVAAGCPFATYEEILLEGTHHLSTIPNTPISVGEGIIVCEETHSLTEEEWKLFEEIFSKVSLVQPVDTAHLSVAGTVSGCGPAFVSMFMEALGDAGVKHGLSRAVAYRLAGQMVAGTGKLQAVTGTHPAVMKDAVCSPGGTTIVGVSALEKAGMRSAIIEAIDAIEG